MKKKFTKILKKVQIKIKQKFKKKTIWSLDHYLKKKSLEKVHMKEKIKQKFEKKKFRRKYETKI